MSDIENTKINPKPKLEHVALEISSSQKVNLWLEQLSQKKRGIKISKKDFVNWLIEKNPENLTNNDLFSLIDRFYDEAVFLRQLLREIKQAKIDGKNETGFELVLKTKKSGSRKEDQDTSIVAEKENPEFDAKI